MLKRLMPDRSFCHRVFSLTIPIMAQSLVTNLVSLVDSLMVGQVGTEAMSAVSLCTQLILIFNMLMFGANAGAGIFSAQFVGARDHDGIRYTFRYRCYICTGLSVICAALFFFFGRELAGLYLQGEGDPEEAAKTLEYAVDYLAIMAVGLIPFAATSAYSGTLRESGQTKVPMAASITAVFTNMVLNYVLIFGKFGAPAMGVLGAAIATVISRFVELGIVAVWAHTHSQEHPFIRGAFRSLYIPGDLLKKIAVKSMPLLLNEVLFSSSTAIMNQSYTLCGLAVLPAMSMVSTLNGLVNVTCSGMASATAIILGQEIGAGKSKEFVMDTNWKLLFMTGALAVGGGCLMACLSGVFPLLYNTSDEVRHLATRMLLIMSVFLPLRAYDIVVYFTIRSGGNVYTTVFFDSVTLWIFGVPVVYFLSRYTGISILPLYFCGHIAEICKFIIGTFLVKKGNWVRNIIK